MSACTAYGCVNRANRSHYDRGITFHKFPHSQQERLKRWTANIRRENWKPSKTSLVCSEHFLDECFDRSGQTVRLRPNAEPTVFAFPEHLQKKSTNRKGPARRGAADESQQVLQTGPPPAVESQGPTQLHVGLYDHSYAVLESPVKLKRKLNKVVHELETCKKKLKVEQQKTRRLKNKVSNLNAVIDSLRNQSLISTNLAEILESTFSGVPQEVFQRIVEHTDSKHSNAYPAVLLCKGL